jgi:type I restriction enzyme, S subunit
MENLKKIEFGEFAELRKEKFNPIKRIETKPCLELEHFEQVSGKINGNVASTEQKSIKNVFYKGDVLFGKLRPYLRKYWLAEFDGVCSSEVWVLKLRSDDVSNEYLFSLVQTNEFIQAANVSSGSKMPRADWDFIINYPFTIVGSKSEQKAIASVLSTWDDVIHNTEQLITQKELRKKWLMQQLLTGKKRLKGFEDRYKKQTVEEVLLPIRNSLSPESNVLYRQIGIRSHGKGIFLKEMVEGRIIGKKRVFWIEPDCLILNIVFAWEQAIAITTKNHIGMIASHRFPMFKPLPNKLNLEYILYFFKSPRGKQMLVNASPGGAGRNKTLGQNEFLNQILNLPAVDEQTAIAQVLQTADKEITLLRAKADKLREQKKGLMQMLLTGKKRLNQNFQT